MRAGEGGGGRVEHGEEAETGLSGCCCLHQCPRSGHDAHSWRGQAVLCPPLHPVPSPSREI